MIRAYLRYLARARDEHSLHSPFLFSLYTTAIRADSKRDSAFAAIEQQRIALRKSTQQIEVLDFGAGSKRQRGTHRNVADMVRHSQKPARLARLLFRLVRYLHANTVLELGTSLGLTTAYLAKAAEPIGGEVTTLEGCPQTAGVARQTFEKLPLQHVRQVVGNIDDTLPGVVARIGSLDFVFFDANHRYEPTIRYFETCLPYRHNDTVFVFDDIHWSAEMEQAWAYVQAHPAVSVTVDVFWMGLVFFRREQPKQHVVLRL